MAKRGPKPRAGKPAEATIVARVTMDELRVAHAIAKRLDCSLADLLRLELYVDSAAAAGMDPLPEMVGQALIDRVVEIELDRRRRITAVRKNHGVVSSTRERTNGVPETS